ncbi:MAG: alpha-L-rhamnosidase N-terminal domain-containing protein [Clostridia bacterium]|nr:alpha-L-rhamnosidase N-terminal domain-containing protein [Clostridia bacterium]
MLSNSQFIKPQAPFHKAFNKTNPSSMFCKYFHLDKLPKSATLYICALGIGYAYINGKRVSEDLFAAPPSDYEKRLWYMRYDVGAFLKEGENVIAVLCGNGFFNEDMQNAWGSTDASWRDHPKMIATLYIDGETYCIRTALGIAVRIPLI